MKILKTIREEIVPLSSKQNIILLTIIACIFQFILFYTPVLAETSVMANSSTPVLLSTKQPIILAENKQDITALDSQISNLDNIDNNLDTKTDKSIPEVKIIRISTHTITAYNSEVAQTDDDPCTTANGYNLCKNNQEDSVAANFLKFGTKIKIPELFGERIFIVRDRMNKKHPNRLDVWMKDKQDALNFGVKVAQIQVLE